MVPQEITSGSKPSIDIEELIAQPKKAVTALLAALKLYDPADGTSVSVQQLSGAMTNLVYRVALVKDGAEQQVVLLRVHASQSELFDRAGEIATFRAVASAGLGPRLHVLFGNGRVEEFLVAHATLGAGDMRGVEVSAAIGATLARFHLVLSAALATSPHHADPVMCWSRLYSWAALAATCWGGQEKLAAATGIPDLEGEISLLQASLTSSHRVWVAACHNDLQYGNIMALPATPEAAADAAAAAVAAAAAASRPVATPTGSLDAAAAAADGLQALEVASSPSASSSSGFFLRGRRHNSNVQLEDGSIVMAGMKARPRGQSPEVKRPEGGLTTSGSPTKAALHERSPLGAATSSSFTDTAAAAAAGAAAGGGRKEALPPAANLLGPPSSADLSTLTAAAGGGGASGIVGKQTGQQQQQPPAAAADGAESDDSDDLLPPSADPVATNWQQRAARVSNSGSAASYRALRAEMRHPGDGVQFPGLGGTSDAGGDSSGLSDDEGEQQQQQQQQGRQGAGVSAGAGTATPHPTTTTTASSSSLGGPILDSVCLIDYEYAGFNPIALDIANHWCEWAADYHTDTPHILDFSRLPSPQQQQLFVEAYLATLLQQAGLQVPAAATAMLPLPVVTLPASAALQQQLAKDNAAVATRLAAAAAAGAGTTSAAALIAADPLALRSFWLWLEVALSAADVSPARHPLSPGDPVSPGAWRKLVAQVMSASRAYMSVSHLLWALWGYIQAEVSDVDFDFLSYGQQRLQQYLTSRPPEVAAAVAEGSEGAASVGAGEGGSPPVVAELLLR